MPLYILQTLDTYLRPKTITAILIELNFVQKSFISNCTYWKNIKNILLLKHLIF